MLFFGVKEFFSHNRWVSQKECKTIMRYYYTPIRMTEIKATDNTKFLWGCGTGTVINCQWECKRLQSHWETVWQFLTELNILTEWSNNCSLIFTQWVEKLCPHKKLHTDIYCSFIHNCQNLEDTKMGFIRWRDKWWYIHTRDYYSVLRRNKLSRHEKRNLKIILLSERNHCEKAPCCRISTLEMVNRWMVARCSVGG